MNENKSKVWVPKRAGHDFTAAESFGTLNVIFSGNESHFNPDILYEVALEALKNFHVDKDYLLFSGPPLMNAIAFNVIADMHSRMNILLFLPSQGKYILRDWSKANGKARGRYPTSVEDFEDRVQT